MSVSPDPIRSPYHIVFEEYDLDNGLHVILHRDTSLPIVAVNVWYHVGSKNEREGKTGFAHLFEHMMFQGSANVPPNGHFQYVQQAGGTLNGSTTFDRTNYYETLPAHQLELGLWLEADRMRSLRLDEQTLETQRNVVMEERRSRYDNQPYGTMFEELLTRAYKLQPYRWPTIGSMTDIRNATLDDVRAFHAMYYQPRNASLCIAGDIDFDTARRLVERHFADIPSNDGDIYRPWVHEQRQHFQVRDFVYDAVPLPAFLAAMHIPPLAGDEFPALYLLATILTHGASSRLYRRLVHDECIAQTVYSGALGLELPGLFMIRAGAQQGVDLDEIEDAIFDTLAKVREQGVTEAELEKAKNGLEAMTISDLASVQSRADGLNSARILLGDASHVNSDLPRLQAVTADEVQRVANAYLVEENSTVLHYLPWPGEVPA
ncbi:MAG: insulinase family protein [Ignavibacteriae bacterium]|nr:insulinase family protein [Ignavibacteriota bacterium]